MRLPLRLGWCAAVALTCTGLFVCYLLQARTYPVNSDGAANVLQAWEMTHGNALLHGWWLSDVSFYTTELPEYALVSAVIGRRPEVVQAGAALTYTLLVLLVVFVAAGRARGREGVVRGLLAGGIMVAPALGYGTYAVLSSPDHTGTGVPVMLILLLLDRLNLLDLLSRPGARRYLPVLGIGGLFGTALDRVSQILVVSVVVLLVAAQFSTAMTTILSVREIAPLLPASAALAGRVVGARLAGLRLRPGRVLSGVLGVVLAGYLAALGYNAAQPAAPPENQALADWLSAHNLRSGLAGYWQADSVTLDSGGRVRVAPIFGSSPYTWESKPSWYDPGLNHPDFVVTVSSPQAEQMFARPAVILRVFGVPARVYHFQRYTIDVYDKNLLTDLGTPPPLPPSTVIAGALSR